LLSMTSISWGNKSSFPSGFLLIAWYMSGGRSVRGVRKFFGQKCISLVFPALAPNRPGPHLPYQGKYMRSFLRLIVNASIIRNKWINGVRDVYLALGSKSIASRKNVCSDCCVFSYTTPFSLKTLFSLALLFIRKPLLLFK